MSRTVPSSSTMMACSPCGPSTKPRSLPEARTSGASSAPRTIGSDTSSAGPVLANGFTASTSAPSFASTDGMTIDAAPCE